MLELVTLEKGTHNVWTADDHAASRRRIVAHVLHARGEARVTTHDLPFVYAFDRAHVHADCGQVRAWGESSVLATSTAFVHAFNKSKIHAKDNAIVCAYHDVEVVAEGHATVILLNGYYEGQPNNARVSVRGRHVLVIDRRLSSDLIVTAPRRNKRAVQPAWPIA